VREATDGGATVVVDTTPFAPGPPAQAVAMARRRGRIVLAGLKGRRATPDFFADDVIYKELTIRGVLGMPYADFERAVQLLEARTYPFEKLHTHSFPVEQAELALRVLAGKVEGAGAIHVAIVPGAPPVHAG
jgi:threonine dehydrogenase-like Zn-dependent dehydrogenase